MNIKVGDVVRVKRHKVYSDLRGNATHSDMHDRWHWGYHEATVTALLEGGGVEVEISGMYDIVPERSIDPLDDVLTASEVEQFYGLGKGTVRVECNRKSIPARKSGETWLLRRADAEARWGKKD